MSWVSVGVIVLTGVVVAWYARPIVQAHRIGVPWRFTMGQAHCSRSRVDVDCTTDWPQTPGRAMSTSVQFTPFTRRLLRADRTWNLTDSSAWARVVDSTRRALAATGMEPLPCDSAVTGFPVAQAWHLGAREIRLYAAPRLTERGLGVRRYATVQLLSFGAFGCGPRYSVRLLTPAEFVQATRDWLAKQVGFQ
jgi:hypothetical protein